LGTELGVPINLINRILTTLVNAKLVFEGRAGEGYVPARPLDQITCEHMLNAMRAGQGSELATCEGPDRTPVREEFERIWQAEREAASAITLQSLVSRVALSPAPSVNRG
jgi:DNA-binding IscR family transcriptional regulator